MKKYRHTALFLTFALATPVSAGPLDAAACARLSGEIKTLEVSGVRTLMTKGPDAVATTLAPLDRQRIKRLLDAEAQVKFRCPQDQPLIVLRDETVDETQDQVLPGDDDGTATAPKPKAKTPPKKQPQREGQPVKAAPTAPPVSQGVVRQEPTPKRAPRPKADDAFKPTAPATNTSGDAIVPPVTPQRP